jgi:subtilisin family serine protease
VIQAVSGTVTLTLVDRFELTYLDTFPLNPPARFHLAERVLLVMDLYRITDRTPVVQAVALINQQAVALGFEVFADPNYLTGRPPILTTGDPWTIEGSPAGGSAQAAQELFRTQWTFRENGIRLFAREERAIAYTGQRVRVGVFDTSPFDEPGEKRFEEVTLRVSHPKPAVDLRPPPEAQDVRDHGVYVAGLVHAVAPNSDIHLIRVLNEYGQGDLYTLNKALDTFIKETLADRGLLTGSTINLSLGVHQPPDPGALGLPADVVALETIVFGAERLGLVVVAAAGNDSNATTVQPMQLPAAYPVVIGVSASNIGRGRACFSNRGDVAAPGGDGGLPDCAPMVYQCFSQPAYCSISLAWTSDTNYVYWTGTSFAAPLVTGLATLMLEKGGTRMTPARVAAAIYRAALPADEALGAGIVDLQRTLLPSTYYLPLVINGWLP